jgi:hypothetical protein
MSNGDTTNGGVVLKIPGKGRQAISITLPIALAAAAVLFVVRYSRTFGHVENEFGTVKTQCAENTKAVTGINSRLDKLETKAEARHEAVMESLRRMERSYRERGQP